MPYQQVVQLPKKPMGRGVVADTPAGKTAPVGGTMQDHGRPAVRGQGHGSCSDSHPRGVPEMVSAQPQHQEGGLPSGLTPSGGLPPPPPPPVLERTQPQWRGRTRSALWDPVRLAANFHSSGWRKDLKHILKVYYKYSVNYFMEGDWFRIKEQFFDHFLQHKKEALEVKEACPLDFMAYIQDLFYQATGIHLDGLRSFTQWIKRGSYYHGIVAHQGHLGECPHLAGAPLPRWPQVAPSESRQESQMKVEAQTPSSSRPSAGAMAVPVVETPIAEASVEETDVMEAPAETPGAEALIAPSTLPASMETGGAGDGPSWAEQVEAREEEFQRSRPAKHPRSQSRRCESTPWLPFPLQDHEGRFASVARLYEHAAAQPATPHNVVGQVIGHLHPDLLPQKAMSLENQVACMIAEYHLTASAHQSSLRPILPHEVAPLLPPIKNYILGVSFEGIQDVRVMDHAVALRVAVWLHRLNMAVGGEALASESLEAGQHYQGPLLESFLTPRTSGLTYQEVVDQVLMENRRAADQSLCHLQECCTHEREVLEGLIKVHGELDKADKAAQKSLKKEIDQRRKGLKMFKERISHYEAQLGQEPSEGSAPSNNGQICHGAQAKAAPAPVANDAPSENAEIPALDPSPAEDQAQAMEVGYYAAHPSQPSPVSREDDNLLLGLPPSGAMEVE